MLPGRRSPGRPLGGRIVSRADRRYYMWCLALTQGPVRLPGTVPASRQTGTAPGTSDASAPWDCPHLASFSTVPVSLVPARLGVLGDLGGSPSAYAAIGRATRIATSRATEKAAAGTTRRAPGRATWTATRAATGCANDRATSRATEHATRTTTRKATGAATCRATERTTWGATGKAIEGTTDKATWPATDGTTEGTR